MDDVCVVCMESLDAEHAHTMDTCGHRFHSRCIIAWLQRGNLSCPTCRQSAHRPDAIPPMALCERARYIRRTVGRRASAPSELLTLIRRVRDAEERERRYAREHRDYCREHRDVLRRAHALRGRRYMASRRARLAERLLGLFQTPSLTLPALMVHTFS